MTARRTLGSALVDLLIIVFLAINLSPLIVTLSNSLRAPDDTASPFELFRSLNFESYSLAFRKIDYFTAFANSVLITSASVVAIIVVAAAAAYPLSRIQTRPSRALGLFFLAGIIVSAQIAIVPIYRVFKVFGLNQSRLAPILMYVSGSMPFCIFLYTGFIRASIPVALEEAALMDGARAFRRFWIIVFPLLVPATVTIIVTQGVAVWNDFFMPMLFLTKHSQKPLTLAMLGFMGDVESPTQWNTLFAACYLCTIPLLAVFAALQRHFVGGLSLGSIKG
jgi:raffinose/stachyose/melibiose transport system permease protein